MRPIIFNRLSTIFHRIVDRHPKMKQNENEMLQSSTNINDLPDLCLILIMEHLNLREQMHLHRVCRRWNMIQRQVFIRRHSLRLIIYGNECLADLDYDTMHAFKVKRSITLKIVKLTNDITYKLINMFPNITTLDISFTNAYSVSCENVSLMLNDDESFWPKQLVQLSLFFFFRNRNNSITNMKTLFKRINSELPLLRKLILVPPLEMLWRIEMPIIAQLEWFYLHTMNSDHLLELFERYIGPNNRLTDVRFFGKIYDYELLVCRTRNFYNAIQWLNLHHSNQIEPERVVRDFPSLTKLNICCIGSFHLNLSFFELGRQFALFNNLTELTLSIAIRLEYPFSEYDSLPDEDVPVLNNLRCLELRVYVQSHHAMESRHLKRMFPKLESLTICYHSYNCQTCPRFIRKLTSSRSYCKSRLFRPWRQCTSIKRFIKRKINRPNYYYIS